MAKQTINIGTTPNDGTGDPIRDAMEKINENFDEIYSSYIAEGSVTTGNSTVNTVISNTGGLVVSNSTISAVANTTNFTVGNASIKSVLTSSQLYVNGTSTVGSALVNTTSLALGNATVNTVVSKVTLKISNTTSSFTANSGNILVGNSTVNASVNSSVIKIASANLTSNTLTLGSSTDAANGYTYLPNGFKMNWGKVSANSSDGAALFTSAFTTNAYVVVATSNATGTYVASVISQNNTIAEIRTANATLTDVYFTAIGK